MIEDFLSWGYLLFFREPEHPHLSAHTGEEFRNCTLCS